MKTLGMAVTVQADPSDGRAKLIQRVQDLVKAINACLQAQAPLGAIMLVYAGLDGFAWLSRPTGIPDVRGEDFKTWVRDFLLPGSGLNCSDEDVWSARCAVLHTQTSESRLSRSGDAKPLWYAIGGGLAYIPVMASSPKLAELVDIKDLLAAFQQAVNRFDHALDADAGLRARVLERAVQYFDLGHVANPKQG